MWREAKTSSCLIGILGGTGEAGNVRTSAYEMYFFCYECQQCLSRNLIPSLMNLWLHLHVLQPGKMCLAAVFSLSVIELTRCDLCFWELRTLTCPWQGCYKTIPGKKCIYICVCVCTHIYTYTYKYIYIHTHRFVFSVVSWKELGSGQCWPQSFCGLN